MEQNLNHEISHKDWKGESDGDYKFMFTFFAVIAISAFVVYGYGLLTSLTL